MVKESTAIEVIGTTDVIAPEVQEQESLLEQLAQIDKMKEDDLRSYTKDVVMKLRAPPMEEHSVVGALNHNGQRNLIVLKDRTRLMVGDFIGSKTEIGENVWVHKNANVAVAKTGRSATGKVASIKAIRPNQALIVSEHEERWINWDTNRLGELKIGFRVALLEDWTIVRTWEDPSSMELITRPKERYSDVGGLDNVINEVRKTIDLPRKMKNAYAAMGIKRSGAILLHGPPGSGKTLLARAIAGENDASFFGVKVSDIYSKWVGEAEARVREIFARAKEHQPSIIFFDEFDALGVSRGDGDVNHVYNSITAELLQQMDGLEDRGDVTLIAATNQVDLVDAAFKRHGRFDKIIEVPKPNREAALQIACIHMPNNLQFEENVGDVRNRIVEVIFDSNLDASGALIRGLADETKVNAIIRAAQHGHREAKIAVKDVDNAAKIVLSRK